jgi:mRNA interferase HicA
VTGDEFIRRVRRLGRQRGVPVALDSARGKGDHRRLGYGDRHTFVGDRGELKKGTLHKMLRDLGLTLGDLTGA